MRLLRRLRRRTRTVWVAFLAAALLGVVAPAPARAGTFTDGYAVVTGFTVNSKTSLSVTYKVKKTYPSTHRIRLEVYNVHSTVKLISKAVTTSRTVGSHTMTFSGLLPIVDVLNVRLSYQEFITAGTYRTKDATNNYRLFGPSGTKVKYHTVTQAEATSRAVVQVVPGYVVTLYIASLTGRLGAVAGVSYDTYQAVRDVAEMASRTSCTYYYALDYLRITSTISYSGTTMTVTQKIDRWFTYSSYLNSPNTPQCSATQRFTI